MLFLVLKTISQIQVQKIFHKSIYSRTLLCQRNVKDFQNNLDQHQYQLKVLSKISVKVKRVIVIMKIPILKEIKINKLTLEIDQLIKPEIVIVKLKCCHLLPIQFINKSIQPILYHIQEQLNLLKERTINKLMVLSLIYLNYMLKMYLTSYSLLLFLRSQ